MQTVFESPSFGMATLSLLERFDALRESPDLDISGKATVADHRSGFGKTDVLSISEAIASLITDKGDQDFLYFLIFPRASLTVLRTFASESSFAFSRIGIADCAFTPIFPKALAA